MKFPAKSIAAKALILGAVSAVGFAPLGLWPVTLVAFALFIQTIEDANTGRFAFLLGWLFGLGHFAIGLNWIAHAFVYQDAMPHWLGYVAVLVISLYLALYPAATAWIAWRLARRRGARQTSFAFIAVFAGAWGIAECLRGTLFTGFPWNPLGVIFVPVGWLPKLAMGIGTYGLSAVAALIAGGIAMAMRRRWVSGGAILLPAVVLTLIPKTFVQTGAVRDARPLLRVVQHNISQAERHDKNYDEKGVRALEGLSGVPGRRPRLVLWPEGSVPYFLEDEYWARWRFARLLGPGDLLMAGGDTLVWNRQGKLVAARNSVFVITPRGQIMNRYDKAHLVPYGEYLPARTILSAIGLSRLVPGDLDFWPGSAARSLPLGDFGRAGIQICYEIIFAGHVVDRANRPDFIFNPSTDAWFGGWGPPQHLAQARLRAIEEGLPVVRSTPTGISAVIDADGRLLASLPLDKPGFLQTDLPPPHAPTLFARVGNIVSVALSLILIAAGVAIRHRSKWGALANQSNIRLP